MGIALFILLIILFLFRLFIPAIFLCCFSVLFLILGGILYGKHTNKKIEQLKNEGLRYDAKIEKIITNYKVIIGYSVLVRLECSYTNENGENCAVKSESFMLPFDYKFLNKDDINQNDLYKNGYSYGRAVKYLQNGDKTVEASIRVMRVKIPFAYVLYDCASKYFGNNSKETLNSVVYVNRNDPADYYLEVYSREK